jgi:hypothetical protein
MRIMQMLYQIALCLTLVISAGAIQANSQTITTTPNGFSANNSPMIQPVESDDELAECSRLLVKSVTEIKALNAAKDALLIEIKAKDTAILELQNLDSLRVKVSEEKDRLIEHYQKLTELLQKKKRSFKICLIC